MAPVTPIAPNILDYVPEKLFRPLTDSERLELRSAFNGGAMDIFEFPDRGVVAVRLVWPLDHQPHMEIYSAYSYAKSAGLSVIPVLVAMAALRQCSSVRAISRRLGMGRYLEKFGFTVIGDEYVLELDDGR